MTTLAIVATVLGTMVAVGLAIWLIPRWQIDRWRRAGIADEEKLAALGMQARTSITQALGGLALIVTLAITGFQANETRRTAEKTQENLNRNFLLAERGQVSERFAKAVEQLGATDGNAPAIDLRLGALFSLMRIGIDSETNRQPALLVVAAYVTRNVVPPPTNDKTHGCDATFRPRTTGRRNCFAVRAAQDRRQAAQAGPDSVSGGPSSTVITVDELNLNRFNLTGVQFAGASLNGAQFRNAELARANFDRACLIGADFHGRQPSLKRATFRGARMTRGGRGRGRRCRRRSGARSKSFVPSSPRTGGRRWST